MEKPFLATCCCNDLSFQCTQIKKAAQKRKEEDADFEEKRMILGITAEGDEDENDKENLMRRREMMRSRLEKDPMFCEEEDIRNRRGGDIVSRWRDKRDSSPVRVCKTVVLNYNHGDSPPLKLCLLSLIAYGTLV